MIILLLFALLVVGVDRPIPFLSGRHVYYILEDNLGTMGHQPAAMIAVFTPSCRREFMNTRFTDNFWPGRPFITTGWYDQERRPKEWFWQKSDKHMDLSRLLGNPTECPGVIFLPKNYLFNKDLSEEMERPYPVEMVTEGVDVWTPSLGIELKEWMWSKLKVEVVIYNDRQTAVSISNRQTAITEIAAGASAQWFSFASEDLTIESMVHALPHEEKIILRVKEDRVEGIEQLFTKVQVNKWEELLSKRHQFTTFTSSSNIVIPPKLPNFTKTGFKLIQMPENMLKSLQDYYWGRLKTSRRPETFFPGYTIINSYTKNPGFVSLGQYEMNRMFGDQLRELVADWSEVPADDLELTSFYGIREYNEDHFLRCHVDRSQTHVLSVILHVASEDLESNWPVEVVDFNGRRQRINMHHGQILFYESAKLIHGRPQYLKAGKFVNAFGHYRPKGPHKHLWGYKSRNDAIYGGDGKLVVDVKLDRMRDEIRRGKYDDYYCTQTTTPIRKTHWKDEL